MKTIVFERMIKEMKYKESCDEVVFVFCNKIDESLVIERYSEISSIQLTNRNIFFEFKLFTLKKRLNAIEQRWYEKKNQDVEFTKMKNSDSNHEWNRCSSK